MYDTKNYTYILIEKIKYCEMEIIFWTVSIFKFYDCKKIIYVVQLLDNHIRAFIPSKDI